MDVGIDSLSCFYSAPHPHPHPQTSSQAPGFQTRPRFSLLFYLSIKSFVHDSQVGGPSWAAP